MRAFRTTAVTVRTSRKRPVNTDGELTTHTPAHFRIREKAIHVFAPDKPDGRPATLGWTSSGGQIGYGPP